MFSEMSAADLRLRLAFNSKSSKFCCACTERGCDPKEAAHVALAATWPAEPVHIL